MLPDDRTQPTAPAPLEHAGMVHYFARRYAGRAGSLDYEDLVGYGWVGVLEACRRCDPARRDRFPGYLAAWIKKEILEAIRHRSAPIRVPDHLQRRGVRPPRREPAFRVEDVAARTERIDPERWGATLAALARLDPRARGVVGRHFGLDGSAETLIAIANDLGVELPLAKHIKAHALDRLRRAAHADGSDGAK